MSIDEYKQMNENFETDIYENIDLRKCIINRNVIGGPSPEQVRNHIEKIKSQIEDWQKENVDKNVDSW